MIAHFERKFTSPTETFIVNQIATAKQFDHAVFTVKNLHNLPFSSEIYAPEKISFPWQLKILSTSHRRYLAAVLDMIEPRVFHTHYTTDAVFFHPLTKRYRVPKICSAYGYDVSSFPKRLGPFSHMFFKNIFAEYTFFISMSEDMRKDMVALGFPPDKILVHYHGIDTASFHVERTVRPRSDSLHILTIGNLEERKGHIVSLRAIKVLKSLLNTVNIKFRIVGSGPLKDNLKSFAEANGLRNNVEFREAVKHGPAFLDNLKWAHVFLHPSNITAKGNKEGIPGTIVEAMSSGLPVVSTVHAGIPETITHDVNGFLVQEKDYREIAKYLKILYENQDLSFTIGQRAREYACRNLDIHRRAIHLENIYLAALASTREKILRPYGDRVRE